jgi:PrtD family type I secretion system ABC transporter
MAGRKNRVRAVPGTEAEQLDKALRECLQAVPSLALFGFFVALLALAIPLYTMQIFDRVLGSGRVETLVMLTIIVAAALLTSSAFEMVRGMILGRVSRWLEGRLTPTLVEACVKATLMGKAPSTQPLQDLATLRTTIGGSVVTALLDIVWAPMFLIVVWLIHPALATVGILAIIIGLGILIVAEVTQRGPTKEANQLAAVNLAHADSAVRNADVFQSMGMLPAFVARWEQRHAAARGAQQRAADFGAVQQGASKFVRYFAQVLIMGVGAYLVLHDAISGGAIIAASMLMARGLAPIDQAITAWRQVATARNAYDRLIRMLSLVPSDREALAMPRPEGRLMADGVYFMRAGRREPVLDNINFLLEPGECLGIIGPSASGKSTLCRLIVGLASPMRGHVRLDGSDVGTWPRAQLGPFIGYLPQEVELFEGTVAANIARLANQPDPCAVLEAAQAAGVEDLIKGLPNGFDTDIGSSGSHLSGGQRQRIALARALYGRPPLIVLDEPNANLDHDGERALLKALETAKAWGSTVIIVAHQPHIMMIADQLLVLRDGRVEMRGDRDSVLKQFRSVRIARENQSNSVSQKATGS